MIDKTWFFLIKRYVSLFEVMVLQIGCNFMTFVFYSLLMLMKTVGHPNATKVSKDLFWASVLFYNIYQPQRRTEQRS